MLDLDDLFFIVLPAVWTNMVREAHIVAVLALGQVRALEREMRPAAVPPALGKFPFW